MRTGLCHLSGAVSRGGPVSPGGPGHRGGSSSRACRALALLLGSGRRSPYIANQTRPLARLCTLSALPTSGPLSCHWPSCAPGARTHSPERLCLSSRPRQEHGGPWGQQHCLSEGPSHAGLHPSPSSAGRVLQGAEPPRAGMMAWRCRCELGVPAACACCGSPLHLLHHVRFLVAEPPTPLQSLWFESRAGAPPK